ncbi:hypothetical protein WJX74_007603 [Apatococcus lobatus]|uniref:Potassium channel tetramerisation-type BTB domain-containing protein n=1 Tax=Apatococcus lobatus TaxID=904363 RepID=A0AAW1QH33_9CHLO
MPDPIATLARLEAQTMPSPSARTDTVLQLNVGGKAFWVSHGLLSKQKGSLLARIAAKNMGSWSAEVDGCPFIERDPDLFEYILSWLRLGRLRSSPLLSDGGTLKAEAQFYGLHDLAQALS